VQGLSARYLYVAEVFARIRKRPTLTARRVDGNQLRFLIDVTLEIKGSPPEIKRVGRPASALVRTRCCFWLLVPAVNSYYSE
jgi:hypothetical protein